MKIDKSKLTPSERAFLEDIEKRCGEEDAEEGGAGSLAPAEQEPEATPAEPQGEVAKGKTAPAEPAADGAEDIYKGMHPAVRAELEALKKFRQNTEDKELKEVAKRYAIIGKKEDELVPILKDLKAAGGTAYAEMIAVLDSAVETVEKSGAFSEIGKSGGAGTTEGAAWAKAEHEAAEIMKSKGLSKAQALDEVFQSNPELAKECEEED